MKDEPHQRAAQKSKHRSKKKIKGQEAAQSRLWEFMLHGRTGKPADGFKPSPLFGCSEKE